MIRAEIIAIGSELLTPNRVDTNSLFITEHLNRLGVDVVEKHIVGDDLPRLTAAIRESMATITAGQISGMSRAAALEFSFFVSIPTMAAGTGYELLKSLRPSHTEAAASITATHIDSHGWVLLAIGFVVSFIVAYAVVAWFMQWVRNRGFVPFAVYRIVAGLVILIWALTGGQ
jgi:hypothetical protein